MQVPQLMLTTTEIIARMAEDFGELSELAINDPVALTSRDLVDYWQYCAAHSKYPQIERGILEKCAALALGA